MAELEQVIAKLDIRRAQVLVEAIIVEISDGDGMNLGVQWANTNGGGTQFTDTGLPIGSRPSPPRITKTTATPTACHPWRAASAAWRQASITETGRRW
jgi:type II secretory pathway component GspD/PulD (secretin)